MIGKEDEGEEKQAIYNPTLTLIHLLKICTQ